jgi:DNA-binding CsgD family transcriptional regulator
LNVLGLLAATQGDYAQAAAHTVRGMAICRQLGDWHGVAEGLNALGDIARRQRDSTRAVAMYEQSLMLAHEHGLRGTEASVLHNLGILALAAGTRSVARKSLTDSLELFRELGDRRGVAECLAGLAAFFCDGGHFEHAARLLGAADSLLTAIQSRITPSNADEYERTFARLRAVGGTGAIDAGRQLAYDVAIDLALAEPPPSRVAPEAGGLSPREVEVAGLVTRGLSNREIAAELVIGDRTVATHIEHILAKLNLKSRVQIAAWGAEKGWLRLTD